MKNIMAILAAVLLTFDATAQEKKDCKAKCLAAYSVCQDEYPALAKAQRLEGKVICRILTDSLGKVRFAEVVKPYNPILDEKALEILAKREVQFELPKRVPEIIVAVTFKLGH